MTIEIILQEISAKIADTPSEILWGFGGIGTILFVLLYFLAKNKYKREKEIIKINDALRVANTENGVLHSRLTPVYNAEEEAEKIKRIAKQEMIAIEARKNSLLTDIGNLRASYANKKQTFDNLVKEISVYDEEKSFIEIGVYKPHFDFGDSDVFKMEIEANREDQKHLISEKFAVNFPDHMKVDGSLAQGRTMINRQVKLVLRAFNNECDAIIRNVNWKNFSAMEKRIYNAYKQINKLNESLNIKIDHEYLLLKVKELRLTHEYREQVKEEREHKASLARQKREEEKLQSDLKTAEREEEKYQRMLEKAKHEASKAVSSKSVLYEERIAELNQQLKEAHEKTERAKSMAQQTRKGYIYVVSNIGSFGKGVYKIGMTRRLEPMDRVKELSDASVPFVFDAHAMIYCEDAPTIEKLIHQKFDDKRVNLVNRRKEFFRVSLDDIKAEIYKHIPDADIISGVEAQQYYETLALMELKENTEIQEAENSILFPDAI